MNLFLWCPHKEWEIYSVAFREPPQSFSCERFNWPPEGLRDLMGGNTYIALRCTACGDIKEKTIKGVHSGMTKDAALKGT
jgi:hypothetical protein